MDSYIKLPFNFKELQGDRYLVSNLAGQHESLSKSNFDQLVNSKYHQIEESVF